MTLKLRLYSFTFLLILFFDQLTKWYVLSMKHLPYKFNEFMAIDFALNRGIMSGLFHSENVIVFMSVTLGILLFLVIFSFFALSRFSHGHIILGEVLVMAGALSNILDRVAHGGVIDFIRLNYHHFVWPIFNIADVGIVIGVGLMLWQSRQKTICPC